MQRTTQLIGKMLRTLQTYARRVRAFRPNARLYLLSVVITGAAMGAVRLFLNFYLVGLGYDKALVGQFITVSNTTALLMALPAGYLADRLGRKASLLGGTLAISVSVMGMALWPVRPVLYVLNALSGMAQSLLGVTTAPFLMENSGEEERTYLFSFSMGLQTLSGVLGNALGGYLPGWLGAWMGWGPQDPRAYGATLLMMGGLSALALLPLSRLQTPSLTREERAWFAPLSYAMRQPLLLGKLILPMLLTSIGAGLIMPFMNLFYREVHHQPDTVIGALFAWGSLAMALGLMIAPPLAERIGRIPLVVLTQGISIPFLVILGFAPWFWMSALAYYIRLALMNMSGPVYQAFVMEHVEPSARATVSSLVSLSWSFGWAVSPMVSGWLQERYGFAPAFLGTIALYTLSVVLYAWFFWQEDVQARQAKMAEGWLGGD